MRLEFLGYIHDPKNKIKEANDLTFALFKFIIHKMIQCYDTLNFEREYSGVVTESTNEVVFNFFFFYVQNFNNLF